MNIPSHEYCKECKDWNGNISNCMEICDIPMDIIKEWEKYHAIGTPEECRAAVEKQTTMYWDAKHDECICPRCATHNPTWNMRAKTVEHDKVYCWHCGQSVEF